jgi:hypothetical protein
MFLISMEQFKNELDLFKEGKGTFSSEDLSNKAANLARANEANRKKIFLWTHPDKAGNICKDIFIAANPNQKEVTECEASPLERKETKIIAKTSKLNSEIMFYENFPVQIVSAGYYMLWPSVKHSFIDTTIISFFNILFDQITPEYLKEQTGKNLLEEYQLHREEMEKEIVDNNKKNTDSIHAYIKRKNIR